MEYAYPPWLPHAQASHHELQPVARSSVGPKRQAIHANAASRPKALITPAGAPGEAIGTPV
jgi:hypothetical protein